jgi:superfamily II DNA or RNA helicase
VPKGLPRGAYDHPLTRALARAVGEVEAPAQVELDELGGAEIAAVLGRHVAAEITRLVASLPQEQRVEHALVVANRLLEALPRMVDASVATVEPEPLLDAQLEAPARRLVSVHVGAAMPRPQTPLGSSTLFTRSRGEPGLGNELSHEITCADRVDILVAFITTGGVRQIRDALEQLASRAGGVLPRVRVLTTTFTGTTEIEALDFLSLLPGAEVKVSFDTRRTRLHAKAWLFHRETGLSTAYVGSANLTATALGAGHEWMVKLSAADLPHVVEKFAGTFETLWADDEFERYDPNDDAQRTRLAAALRRERGADAVSALTFLTLRPYPFQEAILDRLEAERAVLGHRRNLVVAATGTGKTVIAAFDYERVATAARVRPRLLFIAHRVEILEQAIGTFRHVLHDGAFGELHGGGHEAFRGEHVFATVQSAAGLLERFPADHWRHIIIDECHHLPAASYQAVVAKLEPDILVGLTATPERTDGRSLLPDFGGRVAAELRIWHAMEQQLLVPFEYYGLADGTDLRGVRWSRSGYEAGALAGLYTGNEARARLVLKQLERRVTNLRDVRGLGFCVTVEHAEFMAAFCSAAGVPAMALHGDSPVEVRRDAPRRLRDREVNLVFTCDLYNEGVDLPFVDTILLLRPTMSATLFLQQLGRGLRLEKNKASCLVLDFIGQHREEFRFDTTLAALTGLPRARLATAVRDGFPFLPSGCSLALDHVARDQILSSLRRSVAGAQRLAAELRELTDASAGSGPVTVTRFLAETGREIDDVYDGGHGWAAIENLAGVAARDEDTEELSRRLGRLLHVDEPTRLRQYRALANGELAAGTAGAAGAVVDPFVARRCMMLDVQLHERGVIRAAEQTIRYLGGRPENMAELAELSGLLEEQVATAADVYPVADWPLALHRHYSRREILAAVGHLKVGGKVSTPVGGVMKVGDSKRELLFVTLDKSGKDFSPTTRYRDYAVSRDRFHWETQTAASVSRPSGRRYLESPGNGWSFHLFVRVDPDAPYAYAGPVEYESHAGDRPIGIVWRLVHALPAVLYDRYATLAQG